MEIRCGNTRLVLLVRDKAIKIGRFRPLRLFFRIFTLPFSKKRRLRFFAKYGPTLRQAVLHDLFAGLYANRNEYSYSRTFADERVMPTVRSLLGGWVVIQPRGKAVTQTDLQQWPHTERERSRLGIELATAGQFCRHPENGRVVLIDYGQRETQQFLVTHA